jgi:hypothetical protein
MLSGGHVKATSERFHCPATPGCFSHEGHPRPSLSSDHIQAHVQHCSLYSHQKCRSTTSASGWGEGPRKEARVERQADAPVEGMTVSSEAPREKMHLHASPLTTWTSCLPSTLPNRCWVLTREVHQEERSPLEVHAEK